MLGHVHQVATEAAHARYRDLPPLPTERVLAGWIRAIRFEDGGGDVGLYCHGAGWPDQRWEVGCDLGSPGNEPWPGAPHIEYVPEYGTREYKRFDATAAARRLLSEARAAGFR